MKHNRNRHSSTFLTIMFCIATPLSAFDSPIPVAKVSVVEVSYQPGAVVFQIDQPVANCPAGDWIAWDGGLSYPPGNPATEADRKSNVRQVTNTLLTAMHTNGRVRVYARNKTATVSCVVEYMHALPPQ
jgi:hypothetical protein